MGDQELAELAAYYEEALHGHPRRAETRQARFLFDGQGSQLPQIPPETGQSFQDIAQADDRIRSQVER